MAPESDLLAALRFGRGARPRRLDRRARHGARRGVLPGDRNRRRGAGAPPRLVGGRAPPSDHDDTRLDPRRRPGRDRDPLDGRRRAEAGRSRSQGRPAPRPARGGRRVPNRRRTDPCSDQPVHRCVDARHRSRVGEGWRRQVVGHHEPRDRAGRSREIGRGGRRRCVGLLDAADARRDASARPRRRRDRPARCARRAARVDGVLRPRGPGRRLARPDVAQGARAVPHRRALGRARLPPRRHAPRNR